MTIREPKRYKLLKDLPTIKNGTIFEETRSSAGKILLPLDGFDRRFAIDKDKIKNLDEWFEEDNTGWITYWYVTDLGQIFRASVPASRKDNSIINANRKIGNYFQTEEEAKAHLEWLKARAILWEDTKGSKNGAFNVSYNTVFGFRVNKSSDYISPMSFETEEDAKRSIKTHEKEWKIYLGVE